eukprot:scaffold7228_cov523-Prasinococcus_capsulatus_cf.AAC.21
MAASSSSGRHPWRRRGRRRSGGRGWWARATCAARWGTWGARARRGRAASAARWATWRSTARGATAAATAAVTCTPRASAPSAAAPERPSSSATTVPRTRSRRAAWSASRAASSCRLDRCARPPVISTMTPGSPSRLVRRLAARLCRSSARVAHALLGGAGGRWLQARADFDTRSLRDGRMDVACSCLSAALFRSQSLRGNSAMTLCYKGGERPQLLEVRGSVIRCVWRRAGWRPWAR